MISTKQVMKKSASKRVKMNKVILDKTGNFPSNKAVCIKMNLNIPLNSCKQRRRYIE